MRAVGAALVAALVTWSTATAAPHVGLTGGWEEPTGQPFTGLLLGLRADNTAGWAPMGQVMLGYAARDRGPLGWAELGAVKVVPHPQAVIRVGVSARMAVGRGAYRWALELTEDPIRWGLYPSGFGFLELEYNTDVAPYGVGLKAGVASSMAETFCQLEQDRTDCTTWYAGFGGGFRIYKQFEGGLLLDAVIGPQTQLTLAWRL